MLVTEYKLKITFTDQLLGTVFLQQIGVIF